MPTGQPGAEKLSDRQKKWVVKLAQNPSLVRCICSVTNWKAKEIPMRSGPPEQCGSLMHS